MFLYQSLKYLLSRIEALGFLKKKIKLFLNSHLMSPVRKIKTLPYHTASTQCILSSYHLKKHLGML